MKAAILPLCVIFLSCGASDRPAPYVISGSSAAKCPTPEGLLPNLMAFMRSGGFEPIAEVIEEELVPTGIFREGVAGFLRLAKQAPPPSGLLEPLGALLSEERVEPAIALSQNALYYIAGQAPAKAPHYEVPAVLGKMLLECNPQSVLTLGEVLLQTHLPLGCEPLTEGCRLGTIALIAPVHTLLADPLLRNLLQLLTFAEVPEDAFVALLEQFSNILKSESFDFEQIRALMTRLVYPFINGTPLHQKIEAVMEVLSVVTKPEVGLMSSLRETLLCIDAKDPDRVLHRMIYNLIIDPQFELVELVGAIGATETLDPDERIARWLVKVIGMLKREEATHRAILGLVGRLFEKKNAERIVPTMIAIKNAGLADDLIHLFDRDTTPCRE